MFKLLSFIWRPKVIRLNVEIDGIEVAYKENRKKDWIVCNEKFLIDSVIKYNGNISEIEKVSNVGRRVLTDIILKSEKANSYRNKAPRKELTERGTTFYDGYEVIRIKGKPVRYHRYLMEKKLGRKLKSSEIVHHIDGDKLNNDINNLFLCENVSEHNLIHDNLEKLAARLIKENVIVFCPDTKEYVYVHTFPENAPILQELTMRLDNET